MIGAIWPGPFTSGGGYIYSWSYPRGVTLTISPGSAGGGGLVPSSAAPLTGFGGCGGPGPGGLIGLGSGCE